MGLAQGEANSAMMLSDGSLATLTGYLLIAYFIGAKLTFFQVTFVNVVFLMTRVASFLAIQGTVERNAYWTKKISEIDPSIPFGFLAGANRGSISAWVIFVLITGGALLFMWQVRHPKSE
jgi:L-cystine uptake protein TcyP (sodium:dicarboxylate symporter family)